MVKGVQKSFREEIDTSSMSPVVRQGVARLGQVGYLAKGVAPVVGGGLLGYGALTFDRQKEQGLDAALQMVLAQPFGRFLLPAAALGSWPSACSRFSVVIPPDVAQQHHVHGRSPAALRSLDHRLQGDVVGGGTCGDAHRWPIRPVRDVRCRLPVQSPGLRR